MKTLQNLRKTSPIIPIFLMSIILIGFSHSTETKNKSWLTDFEVAKKEATEKDKDILVVFLSQRAGNAARPGPKALCERMTEQITHQKEFLKGTRQNFVLVELDCTGNIQRQGINALTQHNIDFGAQNGVHAYPTTVLFDNEGRGYAFLPGLRTNIQSFLDEIETARKSFKKARPTRDKHLTEAANVEGLEKAKRIAAALDPLYHQDILHFYKKELDRALAADPKDEAGLRKRLSASLLRRDINPLLQQGKLKEALTAIDNYLKTQNPTDENKQLALMTKVQLLMATARINPHNMSKANKAVEEIINIDVQGPTRKSAQLTKAQLLLATGQTNPDNIETANKLLEKIINSGIQFYQSHMIKQMAQDFQNQLRQLQQQASTTQ